MAATVDPLSAGGKRIIKVTAVVAADANVPGVLQPYDATWLDLAGGTAQLIVEKNGIPLITGSAAGAGIEVYPGTDMTNGDIKTASGLAVDDLLVVSYGPAPIRYAET
jgi:hypothetical protein